MKVIFCFFFASSLIFEISAQNLRYSWLASESEKKTFKEAKFWYPGSWYNPTNPSAGAHWHADRRNIVVDNDGNLVFTYEMGVAENTAAVSWWIIPRRKDGSNICQSGQNLGLLTHQVYVGKTGSSEIHVAYTLRNSCIAKNFDEIDHIVTDPAYSGAIVNDESPLDWIKKHKDEIFEIMDLVSPFL